jgi:hypothetical protein
VDCKRTRNLSAASSESNRSVRLTLSYQLALAQIYTPNVRFNGEPLEPDLAISPSSGLPCPDHAELGSFIAKLHIQDFAGTNAGVNTLDYRAAAADISDRCQLREWHGTGVQAPDPHRHKSCDSLIATTIHVTSQERTPQSYAAFEQKKTYSGHPQLVP